MKHVVGLSGGKDSTAMALRLHELHPEIEYEYIGNWTGDEPAEVEAHLKRLEGILGAQVKPVCHDKDLIGLINELEMLPNFQARWCTRILKIEPTIAYFESLPKGSILYIGLRADEEFRRGMYGEDLTINFPMRDWGWGITDVYSYLDSRGICVPVRTDCELCPLQRLGQWRDLYFNQPMKFWQGAALELQHGHTFRSDKRDTWPAALVDLAKEFAAGRPLRERKQDKSRDCGVCGR